MLPLTPLAARFALALPLLLFPPIAPTHAFPQAAMQARKTPRTPAAAAKEGTMQTYRDASLGFEYSYPAGFVSSTQAIGAAIAEQKSKAASAEKDVLNCVSVPVAGVEAGGSFRMIVLMQMDTACIGSTTQPAELGELAKAALTQSLSQFGAPVLGNASEYELSGGSSRYKGSVVSATVHADKLGADFFGGASCLLVGKDAVCWEFVSNKCAEVGTMESFPIKLSGVPAQALVPAKSVAPCTP